MDSARMWRFARRTLSGCKELPGAVPTTWIGTLSTWYEFENDGISVTPALKSVDEGGSHATVFSSLIESGSFGSHYFDLISGSSATRGRPVHYSTSVHTRQERVRRAVPKLRHGTQHVGSYVDGV